VIYIYAYLLECRQRAVWQLWLERLYMYCIVPITEHFLEHEPLRSTHDPPRESPWM